MLSRTGTKELVVVTCTLHLGIRYVHAGVSPFDGGYPIVLKSINLVADNHMNSSTRFGLNGASNCVGKHEHVTSL